MIMYSGLEDLIPPELMALLTQDVTNEILATVAEAARVEWIRLAGKELFTTKRDYIAGIQKPEFQPGVATISLVGQLPNVLEHGQDSYDMRDTLLGDDVPLVPPGQRGKHETEDGEQYRAVPFRHGTPTSGGAVGVPMGRAYGPMLGEEAMQLGKDIYREAKKLSATTSQPGAGTEWGGRLEAGLAPKLKAHHAVDIYAGMVRQRKTYKSTTQTQYTTFRTISTRVGPPKWIRRSTRPGLQLAGQVNQFIHRQGGQAFVDYVKGLLGQ